jgi:hypothetical protein
MALSPNYGWAEPDNSSLVKNGAQDIRALGDAIDTSLWNSGYGQAGKNKYINGDFNINQRQFTSVVNPASVYNFDRWKAESADGTNTLSAQTFTAGAAPVAGYESTNFLRIVTSGQTLTSAQTQFGQVIEDVRTLAGNPATVSFWAKANTGTPKIALEFRQNFGSGGSATVSTPVGAVTIGTTWQRYSLTGTVPSASGKTIGANSFFNNTFFVSAGSDFNTRASSIGIQSNTFDVWGFQIEYGSKATPFQTASGASPQAELALCQRYYQKSYAQATAPATASTTAGCVNYQLISVSPADNRNSVRFPVVMRATPTITLFSTNSGTSAKIFIESTTLDVDGVSYHVGDASFNYYLNSGTTGLGFVSLVQYTASAEL